MHLSNIASMSGGVWDMLVTKVGELDSAVQGFAGSITTLSNDISGLSGEIESLWTAIGDLSKEPEPEPKPEPES